MTNGRTRPRALVRALCATTILALAACSPALAGPEDTPGDDGTGSEPAARPSPDDAAGAPGDPWEGMNRGIFWFNDKVDVWVLEPVAKGWDWAVPEPIEHGVSNFFDNLRFPIVFVNEAFQAKPIDAFKTFARFGLNTTLGIAGFLDPASEFGLEATDEDFGQTLGRWGVPSGPYLVLPLFGPSNVRDTGGLAIDSATSITPFFIDGFITMGTRVIDVVNTRAQFLEEIAEAKAASFDYYVFVRNAYEQRRQALIEDRGETEDSKEPIPDEDLYKILEP